jgi:hypothetical protein
MKKSAAVIVAVGVLYGTAHPSASGPLGIYAIVERVVFEPSDTAPERIQVWGAFAYYDSYDGRVMGLTISPAKRGYMYFRLPAADAELVKREWADLKAVAGTGEAVAFGQWGYIGAFGGLQPDARSSGPPYILEREPVNRQTDLRVRSASEPPAAPALYQTNAGMVKLREDGSHADVVKRLRDALKR